MRKKAQTEVALSLGGNIGDVRKSFTQATRKLRARGLGSIRISSVYRTRAVGCRPDTPDFLNAALRGKWPGTLKLLLELCKEMEIDAGRPEAHPRYSSRTLDIDIVFFGDLIYSDKTITVPHIEARKRLFVLIPLAEIAGDWIFPGTKLTVSKLLKTRSRSKQFKTIISSRSRLWGTSKNSRNLLDLGA